MKRITPILLAIMVLVFSSLACQALSGELSLENLRMSHDSDGTQVTSTFSDGDIFYAVADLKNAPKGTSVRAVWVAVDAADTEPGLEFQEQTYDVTDDSFSGTIYFQLSNDGVWPTGGYRVDMYVNDTLSQSVEFSVE